MTAMENKRMGYLKRGLFVALSLLIPAVSFAQSVVNFSGSWAFNESKSNLGENRIRMISQKLSITQDVKILKIERSFTGQDSEERKMSETYTLDGRVSANQVFNTSKKSTATWAADKKSLTVASTMVLEMNNKKNEIKSTEVYKLTDAGRTLSIDYRSTSSMGERTALLVYEKK